MGPFNNQGILFAIHPFYPFLNTFIVIIILDFIDLISLHIPDVGIPRDGACLTVSKELIAPERPSPPPPPRQAYSQCPETL